jgi:cyclophilin family peptidyl-prolyl cis-trans isomerase
MENPTAPKKVPWLGIIVIVLVILAFIQWSQVKGNKSLEGTTANTASRYSTTTDVFGTTTSATTPDINTAAIGSVPTASSTTNNNSASKNLMHTITLETNKGTIVFQSYDADAPKTVENFITLANKGFYNGVIFHRVIENFMIQGGDPTGTGMGGPGYKFADELNPATESYKKGYVRGTVAMANSGPNTNGSQFFIMHKDTPLPNSYTIFGTVVKGIEIVDAIAATQVDGSDKPLSPITIQKVTVTENK